MSKYIKWKLCCDLVLCQVSTDKEDEEGEEGRRGRENRRKGISEGERLCDIETEGKNVKQKRKRVKTQERKV